MERGMKRVVHDLGLERCRTAEQRKDPHRRVVAHDGVPAAVHHDRGIRLLLRQDERERASHVRELRRAQLALLVRGSVAGGEEQRVLIGERHVEDGAEALHHVPARLGTAGFEEAEVAAGDLGLDRERELTEPACLPPVPEEPPERSAIPLAHRYPAPVYKERRRTAITSDVMA